MSEVLTPKSTETKDGFNAKGRPWRLHRVEFTEGTKASTFDAATAKFIEANYGKPINVEISVTEKGKDLISAWPLDGNAPPPKPARVQVGSTSKDDFMRPRNPAESRTIAKQSCLKAAVDFLAARGRLDPQIPGDAMPTVEAILGVADRFVEWVFTEDTGIRHIPGRPANADIEAFAAAIATDKPADATTKAAVMNALPNTSEEAKALLRSYGIKTAADVQKITVNVAELFFAEHRKDSIPL